MKIINSLARPVMVAAIVLASMAAQAQEGVTKSVIVLGQSVALTGPGSALALPFHQGVKLYFDQLNAGGGIGGRKIELVTLDDRGDPVATAANTKKLLDQGVLSLFGYVGSPQVAAAYPLIKDGDVLLFAPMSAADEFRGAMYANIYSLRPGYSEEAVAITRHAETLGARKLGVLHATDGESPSALDAAKSDNAKVQVVRELQADAAAAKLGKPNVYMLEGYIAARVYAEALRRVSREPSRSRLKKASKPWTMSASEGSGFISRWSGWPPNWSS